MASDGFPYPVDQPGNFSADDKPTSLGDALPREMARVRDEVLPEYLSIPGGILAATMMRQSLDAAARAMAEGDVVAMIRCHEDLKGYEV
ncbi:hypothetical protein [Methylorubrum extorquens]|uniref:Uncharacterized protein n=1 Tax=Methylorubrum extorquens (strain ATCC 14718 / DSM 1338 / JCM 2805 / NCIMB 9133 / AM1) TaxID=272630 RepID=C5B193_METEA|nr:hypothetical protein [Methylorubrum extorquens]ACS41694.1 Hypothetical protein MexAM1_META1p4020 [Methylorubrum extorquens AM1]MCP1545289.1 hypothetical protein [Methylorubrum extorquens]MCP1587364.1 hypothetical protein [Methylorubrum extorquens]